jgi:lipoate-protein ligase A
MAEKDKMEKLNITFREIDTGVKTAAWNMASDDALLKMQVERPMPTLRFLSFERCALVGYFQSVSQEIRIDYCHKLGIDINRRITGGGSIYFDPSQVGWEIIAPISLFGGNVPSFYETFGKCVSFGLQKLGINAKFKPRNDIEIGSKKVSGMGGISFEDAFLFQGTLLVQDRIEEMLYSLRVPIEKLKPKEIDSVRERVTCIQHELGRIPDREELKDVIRAGFFELLAISTRKDELDKTELDRIEKTVPFFSTQEWINRVKLPSDSQGFLTGSYRKDFGVVRINMTVNTTQKMVRQTVITGDFLFEAGSAFYDLERILRNIRFEKDSIFKLVSEFLATYPQIPVNDFLEALKEVFKKWDWVKAGFTSDEANSLFAVNYSPGEEFNPKYFLFPYCAKDTSCSFRYNQACPGCGTCTVGNGYKMALDNDLIPITITSFEDLLEKFDMMKANSATAYIGSCCEPFYVKHQEEFRDSGLKGVLINVKDSTCYDLGEAHNAYVGTFESKTELDTYLVEKILEFVKSLKN